MHEFEIFIDGAAKGNPGPAGIGVIICKGDAVIENIAKFIGNATNNVAEYTALIYALKAAIELKAKTVIINSDSQLLCKQLNKEYKVKHPNIVKLYNEANILLENFTKVVVRHIPREQNIGADKLANKAVKERK